MSNNREYDYLLTLLLKVDTEAKKTALSFRCVEDISNNNFHPPNGGYEFLIII